MNVDVDEELRYMAPADAIEKAIRISLGETVSPSTAQDLRAFVASAAVPTEASLVDERSAAALVSAQHSRYIVERSARETRSREVNYLYKLAPAPHVKDEREAWPDDTLVVLVSVFHRDSRRQRLRQQSYRLLGSHTLADVARMLYCLHEYDLRSALAERGGGLQPHRECGAFFEIDDTFYYQEAPATDIHSALIAWLQDEARGPSHVRRGLKSAPMASARLDALRLTVGHHYRYRHAGQCDHWICFDEVRLVGNEDATGVGDYPMMVFRAKFNRKKCGVCATRMAVEVTYDDALAPTHPAFLCADCYVQLHADGVILHSKYYHDAQ